MTITQWVVERRDGVCLYGLAHGGCQFGLDPHHITKRSQGGEDIEENIITLCRKHHDDAEARLITASELREILTQFYGYTYTS